MAGETIMQQGNRYTRRTFLKVAAAGGVAWSMPIPIKRSWAARGSERGALRFIFYTDPHSRVEWETPQALAMAAESINAQGADLAVAGGDLITEGFESTSEAMAPRWDAYMRMHRALKPEIRPVIGNHDLVGADPDDGSPPSPEPRREYLRHLGLNRSYYSFDAVGYHFVVLDSIDVRRGDKHRYWGYIDDEQMEWLKEDLASLPVEIPIVLATHVPLLTGFFQATEGIQASAPPNRVIVNNRDVLSLFQGRNLVLVLQGHLHVDEWLRWRNTSFITGGAICGRWWRGAWHGTREGYGVVTLRPDRVEWEYHIYGWEARRPEHA